MVEERRAKLEGVSIGYNSGAIFRLTNGQVWQQRRYLYRYRYAYRPGVRLYRDGQRQMLEIDGMGEAVEVVRAEIVVEGNIVSDFDGFSGDSKFEFQNGQVWEPAEYKYNYHYAHRPSAIVISGINGNELSVEGMSETLRVRRVR